MKNNIYALLTSTKKPFIKGIFRGGVQQHLWVGE